jgi:hypothetical protein
MVVNECTRTTEVCIGTPPVCRLSQPNFITRRVQKPCDKHMGIARIAILNEINPVLKTPCAPYNGPDAFTCYCTAVSGPENAAIRKPMKPGELLTCCGMLLDRKSRMNATTALACFGQL